MVAIVDAYDAMISYRTYRPSKTVEEAIKELKKFAGTQFDPELVEIFINIILKGQSGETNEF
jgi:HD-GYP domain-containing protein (c-di-GMP phosphodiesterase class II)